MAAGVTDRLWSVADIVAMVDAYRAERERMRTDLTYSTTGPALGFGR